MSNMDSIYFLRNSPGMVILPNTVEEAQQELPGYFEVGVLTGHSLIMLEQVITQVSMMGQMPSVFYLWLSKFSANERRRYIWNVFSHGLRPFSFTKRKWALNLSKQMGEGVVEYSKLNILRFKQTQTLVIIGICIRITFIKMKPPYHPNLFFQVYMPLLSYNQHKNGHLLDKSTTSSKSAPISREDTNMSMAWEDKEEGTKGPEPELNVAESRAKAMLRDEFLINMQKFAASITRTIQQIEGEVRLEVPDVVMSDNSDENLRNPELMAQVEEVCRGWDKQITAALDAQHKKERQGKGPLAEIDYWRERNAALSALYEQLKLPKVRQFLELYSHVDNSIEYIRQDLNKYYTEAKDNVRFLSTLERHFKNITYGASFQVVIDTIPSMMNALRMVWIISRHYNRDERMVPLMERIAWELAERVARVIQVRTLYR